MATSRYPQSDLRRQVGSPRPKGRENKDTLCRNIMIYGHCRYEDQGCTFSHDTNKNNSNQTDNSKKTLNVDSPSFTPASIQGPAKKPLSFTSEAANAPAFTPRGLGSNTPVSVQDTEPPSFNPATVREFTPSFDLSSSVSANGSTQDGGSVSFDPFSMSTVGQNLPATPFNPYAEDHNVMTGAGSFFQAQNAYTAPLQPLQHHLYAPVGPYREDLKGYQRITRDFFIPEKLREEFQKKSEASLQVMPNSQLPQLDNYHSLVALDTNNKKNANIFGYPSWVYKATSSKTGKLYCLRRLEGYRLTNENAIRVVKEWRQISNANVVTVHDAFTTRAFGDSSLIFVQDYHPLSKTLAEFHWPMHGNRFKAAESVLWGYTSQIANALKAIHSMNLAARCVDVSKIILTDKNRIRLSACSILDVVQFENRRTIQELQQEDLVQFGRVLLGLATGTHPMQLVNLKAAIESMSRNYSPELRDTIVWLLSPPQPPAEKSIDDFIRGIAGHIVTTMNDGLQRSDELTSELHRELENGRIARLMMKLGTINERQDIDSQRDWSENGERYMLKLFRDYVFHQVDANGHPVLDMGHMIRCLNKLDAGTDEKICLTSRDEQTSFIVTYKELKKQLSNAFGELQKASKTGKAF